jgi:hypothetical protein
VASVTDRIDLDELDVGDEDETSEEENPGDWFWRDEGPSAETGVDQAVEASGEGGADPDRDTGAMPEDGTAEPTGESADSDGELTDSGGPIPHVPRENLGKPAGIPVETGGSGAGAGESGGGRGGSDATDAPAGTPKDAETSAGHPAESSEASGPHGGGADEMTMSLTYEAAKRLANPRSAVADARQWADWIGIVGDVEAFVLNKFQRDETLDLDFFNGSGTGPGERLREIDRHSMFYAERMVVVGIEGEDEAIAAEADWEFVPLSEAASKAGWELSLRDE